MLPLASRGLRVPTCGSSVQPRLRKPRVSTDGVHPHESPAAIADRTIMTLRDLGMDFGHDFGPQKSVYGCNF